MKHMSDWTEDMIRFMRDASDNSFYFKELANTLLNDIGRSRSVCDCGCGIGQLALEFAGKVREVYAVDKAANAIAELKNKAHQSGKTSVISLIKDMNMLDESIKFNVMVFHYFGKTEDIISISKKHCTDLIFIIKKNYQNHRFSIGKYPIEETPYTNAKNYLDEKGIKYSVQEFNCEFGQPFKNLQDAVLFFELYGRDEDKSLISELNIKKRLVSSDLPGFQYYLPHLKKSIIYRIDIRENENIFSGQ